MEASTLPGGQHHHERAPLELHKEEATFVSKSLNLGHASRVEHKEASTMTLPEGRRKKRALELHLRRDDDDDDDDDDEHWEEKEATFMAGADGAYTNFEMPKRINLGYNVGETSARIRALDAEEERDVALRQRHEIEFAVMMRDMYAKAAAAAAPRT